MLGWKPSWEERRKVSDRNEDHDNPITSEGIDMLQTKEIFSSFAVRDISAARRFYDEAVGLKVVESAMGMLELQIGNDKHVMVYPKPDHQPATYTVLNFLVGDIEKAVDELAAKGVEFERYEGFDANEKGICYPPEGGQGPPIAWFTDPSGNICSVIQG